MKTTTKILIITVSFLLLLSIFNNNSFAGTLERFTTSEFLSKETAEERFELFTNLSYFDESDLNLKYRVMFCVPGTYAMLFLSDYPIKVDTLNSGNAASYISGLGTIAMYCSNPDYSTYTKKLNYSEYTIFWSNQCSTDTLLQHLSTNHDLTFVENDNIAISREETTLPFPNTTPTLAETIVAGYQVAKETTAQTITTPLVELIPVGIVIMATMIVVSLIVYFKRLKA